MTSSIVLDVWKSNNNSSYNKEDIISDAIVGIDLGTSTSCIALWNSQKSRVKIIKNITTKSRTTPSILRFTSSFESPDLCDENDFSSSSSGVVANWKRLLSCPTKEQHTDLLRSLNATTDSNTGIGFVFILN